MEVEAIVIDGKRYVRKRDRLLLNVIYMLIAIKT